MHHYPSSTPPCPLCCVPQKPNPQRITFFASGKFTFPSVYVQEKEERALNISTAVNCRPGSSVGTATDYGLDGPGSNPSGDEIFRPSRPALGSTQAPVQRVPGLSRG